MASTLIARPVAIAKAFSPGHVTGFFEIPPSHGNYLYRGSRGAGFSIDRGISTTVHVFDSTKPAYKISINGTVSENAEVSRWVLEEYQRLAGRPSFVSVDHDVGLPIGFGLGSSGAAALSLSYALNEALRTNLSKAQAAQMAHRAEISCKTGLGTVIAEFAGGFEMRTSAGAPGIGTIDRIELRDYRAVVLCLAPISTKTFLTGRINEINGKGGVMLRKLSETRSVDDFLKMSYEFAETLELTGGICKAPIAALNAIGIEAGVAMFGHTVFTLVPRSRAREAREALKCFGGTLFVCNLDPHGARVL